MKDIWKKYKASFIIIGYIIIVASFVYFIFMPSVNKVKEKSDMIEEKNIDSQMRQASLATVPEMESDYNNYLANSQATDVVLNSQDEVAFIEKLETLAKQTGNTIDLKIDDADTKTGAANRPTGTASKSDQKMLKDILSYNKYVSMNIDLKGNYPSFLNFMNKLENDNYYADVLSISMQKGIVEADNANQAGPTLGNNIFSATSQNGQQNSPSGDSTEILDSTLSVVIYIKN